MYRKNTVDTTHSLLYHAYIMNYDILGFALGALLIAGVIALGWQDESYDDKKYFVPSMAFLVMVMAAFLLT